MTASALIASAIIQMCTGDHKEYRVQDEYTDCHEYYVNCSISKDVNINLKTLEACRDEAKLKTK